MTTAKTTMSIGDRMKGYENVTRNYLYRRTPVIIRLNGKAFHTFTRGMEKPFSPQMANLMRIVCTNLLAEIQGAEIAYTQSDEISIFLRDYTRFESEAWFDNNIQKIVSVAASVATGVFNGNYEQVFGQKAQQYGFFDARVFNLPKEDVINYFIWRQQDATRNSVQGLGQEHLSHKKMQGLNNKEVQEELSKLSPPIIWDDQPEVFKYGQTFFRTAVSMPSPLFKENRDFLNEFIYIKESKD